MMSIRRLMRYLSATLLAVSGAVWFSHAQQMTGPVRAERFRKMSADAETRGLAEPFKGITTAGTTVPGLFAIRGTGVSTEPVRVAAQAWLASLTPAQRTKTSFGLDDPEWQKWMNQHFYVRQGMCFDDMTDSQRIGTALLRRR